MRELRIEIDRLPPLQASPNWNPFTGGAYWIRHRALKRFKEEARFNVIHARNTWERQHIEKWYPLEKATLKPFFTKPRGGPMDSDNAIASLKGLCDVLVQEKIIKDDSPGILTWEKPEWRKGEKRLTLILKG